MSEYQNIPDELQQRDQWLYWNASNDTPRAPLDSPSSPYGCSWSDPETWLSFDEVTIQAKATPQAGIGYVNAADNDDYARGLYGVIDLDGIVDEDGRPKDWVPSLQPFFDRDAYIEWSPSENGSHIPIVGIEVPEWWTDQHFSDGEHEGIEVLTNKFSTFTGNKMRGSGDDVVEYGEWLDGWLREAYKAITGEDPIGDRESKIADDVTDGSASSGSIDEEWFTQDVAEEALDAIDADCSYSVWRDIGMALVNKFGSSGERLFESWSRSGSKWDSDAERQADRIIRDAGNYQYDAGTIIHYAKEAGWDASAAAREVLSARSDGGTAAGSSTTEIPDGVADATSPDGSRQWSLTPWDVIERAVDDPLSALDYDDEGNVDGTIRDLQTHQLAHYVWEIAKDAGEDDALAVEKGPIYAYEDGIWRDDDEQHLRDIGGRALQSQYRTRVRKEIAERVRKDHVKHADELGAPDKHIATEGGLLDLDTRDLQPLKPEHYATSKLPVEPDPDADCPQWRAFLEDSIPDDEQREKFQEYAGYVLWHHAQPFGKALFLVGPTDSGKGTALKALRAVIGGDNIAAESLRSLIDTRWGTASLVGNVANIRNEVSPRGLQNIEQFKELTGGEDEVDAEFKGQQKFKFVVKQKFLFATNQMPSIEDADEAFYNRLLFVEFPNTVPASEQDKDLDAKLEAESAGILNWMLEGLDRLFEQGRFTAERSINGKKELCDAFGGVIDRFTYNCLMVTGHEDDVVAKTDLEDLAKRYADDIGKDPEWDKQTGFTQRMANQLGVSQGQKRIDGTNTKVFRGVRVKPEYVYQFGTELRALTASEETGRNTGLNEFGDDVRPGYDMRTEDSPDMSHADDDRERATDENSGPVEGYKQAVKETVAEAAEPLGVADIVDRVDGDPVPIRNAIEHAKQHGLIDKVGDDQYTV